MDGEQSPEGGAERRRPVVRELALRAPDGSVTGQLARFRSHQHVLVKPGPQDEVMHVLRGSAVLEGSDDVISQGDWLLLGAGRTYSLQIAPEGMRALIVPRRERERHTSSAGRRA